MQFNLIRKFGFPVIQAWFCLLVAALFLCACSSGKGTLAITWTIASESVASLCGNYNASNVAVLINETSGNSYASSAPACSSLSTSYSNVPDGTYSVTAQMMGVSGNTVSKFVGPIVVTVTSGNTTIQNIDFPAASFNIDSTSGTLTVAWTIASSSAAAQCSTYGAVNLSVTVLDSNGNQYGDTTSVACTAATTNIPNVDPGSYTVIAQMLNANDQPVSSVVNATNVVVSAHTTTRQLFDFPASAFAGSKGAADSGS
jgi:hypothetical protein